jgi:DNA-binding MarR family transcriptional regulator
MKLFRKIIISSLIIFMSVNWKKISQFTIPEESVGYLISKISHDWEQHIEASLLQFNITYLEFMILAGVGWLTSNNQLITQVKLAEFWNVDVMRISQAAKKLELKGFIVRQAHPIDTRAKIVNLTSQGEKILSKAICVVEKLENLFFGESLQSELLPILQDIYRQ